MDLTTRVKRLYDFLSIEQLATTRHLDLLPEMNSGLASASACETIETCEIVRKLWLLLLAMRHLLSHTNFLRTPVSCADAHTGKASITLLASVASLLEIRARQAETCRHPRFVHRSRCLNIATNSLHVEATRRNPTQHPIAQQPLTSRPSTQQIIPPTLHSTSNPSN